MKSKSQYQRDFSSNRALAEQWRKMVQQRLNTMLGVGDRRGLPGGNPNPRWTGATGDGSSGDAAEARGGMSFQRGVSPTNTQVDQYIKSLGGNPYSAKARQAQRGITEVRHIKSAMHPSVARSVNSVLGTGRRRVNAVSTKGGLAAEARRQAKAEKDQEKSSLKSFLEDAQSQYDKANAANESRYTEILGDLRDNKTRNLDRVANYGVAASADLDERAAEVLGGIRANLSARGLGNSTVFDSFRQRNSRDLAREQQRLSEQVDSRTAEYDTKATNDIAAFMEKRTDQAPDYGQIAGLAQQFGLSGDGEGFAQPPEYSPGEAVQAEELAAPVRTFATSTLQPQQQQQQQPQQQVYQRQGLSAGAAMQIANSYQAPNYNQFAFGGIQWGGDRRQQQQQSNVPWGGWGFTEQAEQAKPKMTKEQLAGIRAERLKALKESTAAASANNNEGWDAGGLPDGWEYDDLGEPGDNNSDLGEFIPSGDFPLTPPTRPTSPTSSPSKPPKTEPWPYPYPRWEGPRPPKTEPQAPAQPSSGPGSYEEFQAREKAQEITPPIKYAPAFVHQRQRQRRQEKAEKQQAGQRAADAIWSANPQVLSPTQRDYADSDQWGWRKAAEPGRPWDWRAGQNGPTFDPNRPSSFVYEDYQAREKAQEITPPIKYATDFPRERQPMTAYVSPELRQQRQLQQRRQRLAAQRARDTAWEEYLRDRSPSQRPLNSPTQHPVLQPYTGKRNITF